MVSGCDLIRIDATTNGPDLGVKVGIVVKVKDEEKVMNLMRWEPFEAMKLFNYFPNSFGRPLLETGEYSDWSPFVDISETGQEYLIQAALPAVKKEDVKV